MIVLLGFNRVYKVLKVGRKVFCAVGIDSAEIIMYEKN